MRSNLWNPARAFAGALGFVVVSGSSVDAVDVPFTEAFVSSSSSWRDASGADALGFSPLGGADGGGFATTTFNFVDNAPNDTPALFRGQSAYGSSNGAFVGDWLAGGVTEFNAFVRHNAEGQNLTYFARFASPFNFPAMVAVTSPPVPANEWTQIRVLLSPGNFIPEGPSSFDGVFSNIGNVQIGVMAMSLAGVDQPVTFDLDSVSIVPEPTAALLLGVGGLAVVWRRRRRSV